MEWNRICGWRKLVNSTDKQMKKIRLRRAIDDKQKDFTYRESLDEISSEIVEFAKGGDAYLSSIENIKPMCSTHKPIYPDDRSTESWAKLRLLHGIKQKQCKVCGYWFFKDEI